MFIYEIKLNVSADWKSWKKEFQSMTIIANIWKIVQDCEIQIQKFIESNIKFFFFTFAAATAVITCS